MTTTNEDRMKFVGASEVSAVMGINPWMTPLQLWAVKTGSVPPKDLSDNEAVEWGSRLERVVSEKFADKNGVKLMAYKRRFVHPDYPFFSCELDNIVTGTDEIVEIKTCNANAHKDWADQNQIPPHYIVQVMAQLGLSGRSVGHIAVLCGGQKYFEKRVQFDPKMYAEIVSRVVAFWKMVEDKTPPEAVAADNDNIQALYPNSNHDLMIIESINEKIKFLQEKKMHLKQLDEEKDELEAQIKQIIGVMDGIKTSEYVVTWKEQSRQVVDTDAMKLDGVYEGYTKESKSRVFRVAKNRGE